MLADIRKSSTTAQLAPARSFHTHCEEDAGRKVGKMKTEQ